MIKKEPEIELLGKKIAVAQEKLPEYDKLENFEIEIRKAEKEIYKLENELLQSKRICAKTTQELEADKYETEKLLDLELKLQHSIGKCQELEEKYQQL